MMLNRVTFIAAIVLFGGIALGQSYSVTGEVVRPGSYDFRGGATVLKAIAVAGGLTPSAIPEEAVIIREDSQIPVNVKFLMRGRIKDIQLLDGDELRIPSKVPSKSPYLIAPVKFQSSPLPGQQ